MLKILFIDPQQNINKYYTALDESIYKRLYCQEQLSRKQKNLLKNYSLSVKNDNKTKNINSRQSQKDTPKFYQESKDQKQLKREYFKNFITDSDFQQVLSFVRENFGDDAKMLSNNIINHEQKQSQVMKEITPQKRNSSYGQEKFIENKQCFLRCLKNSVTRIIIKKQSRENIKKESEKLITFQKSQLESPTKKKSKKRILSDQIDQLQLLSQSSKSSVNSQSSFDSIDNDILSKNSSKKSSKKSYLLYQSQRSQFNWIDVTGIIILGVILISILAFIIISSDIDFDLGKELIECFDQVKEIIFGSKTSGKGSSHFSKR